jgi:hypothetical protein
MMIREKDIETRNGENRCPEGYNFSVMNSRFMVSIYKKTINQSSQFNPKYFKVGDSEIIPAKNPTANRTAAIANATTR